MTADSDRPGTAGPRRGFATRAVHGVRGELPAERPLAMPIWQTSAFSFDDAEHYAHTLRQPRQGFVYTRYENPTTAALEATVAGLEGAVATVQKDANIRKALRPAYAHDPNSLIAVSHVVATHFQTIAAANNYWRK